MKKNIAIAALAMLLFACKKEENNSANEPNAFAQIDISKTDITNDTIGVSTDFRFHPLFYFTPLNDFSTVIWSVLLDGNKVSDTTYNTPSSTTDNAFLLDLGFIDVKYNTYAGVYRYLTYQAEGITKKGKSVSVRVVLDIAPLNYPFQFRFFDFKNTDTVAVGTTVTMRPFYVPLLVGKQVKSMKVFRKAGFAAEAAVDSFSQSDFFFYQTGYLREYEYTVPATIPSGSGVSHRFELVDTDNKLHIIQHRTVIQ